MGETTPTFLNTITIFFSWILQEVGNLITFILGNELLIYMIAIIFISFIIKILVKLIKENSYIKFDNGYKMKVKNWKKVTYDPYKEFHKRYGYGGKK